MKYLKPSAQPPSLVKRRNVLKAMAGLPFLGPLAFASQNGQGDDKQLMGTTDLSRLKGQIPHHKIKGLEISRMIMGGNLIGGWPHARDLIYVQDLVKAYLTEEKVFSILQMAEQCGMNSLITNPIVSPLLQKYWKQGGKIQFISDGGFNLRTDIQKSIDIGASACYVHGGIADRLVLDGKFDEIAWALDTIRKNGIPAGIAGHELETIKKCTEKGLVPDFWMKTLHKTSYWSARIDQERKSITDKDFADNIFCPDPDETSAFMNSLEQPWIAFKILAAGAINPRDAFQWAFEKGADFICVGMFDFQMIDNVNLACDVLGQNINRVRPWR